MPNPVPTAAPACPGLWEPLAVPLEFAAGQTVATPAPVAVPIALRESGSQRGAKPVPITNGLAALPIAPGVTFLVVSPARTYQAYVPDQLGRVKEAEESA